MRVGREDATGGHTALLVAVDPRGLPPPVAIERGLARVARLAQRAQVRLVVGAAVFQRDHVVDLSHGRVPATGQAVLTQRVGFDVGRADLSPPVVVATVDLRVALVVAVAGVLGTGVLGAKPLLGQLGTTGVGARALGFPWHQAHHPCRSWQRPQTNLGDASGGRDLLFNHLQHATGTP